MTTDINELVKRLRDGWSGSLRHTAADALEALAGEVERLREERDAAITDRFDAASQVAQGKGGAAMSEDIVVQLRGWSEGSSDDSRRMVWLMRQSADTIEALRGERDHAAGNAARYLGLLNAAEARVEALRGEVKAILQREHEQCIALGLEIKELRADAEKAEAEAARLKGALVEHNDVLRSAFQIAKREGAETNWTGFANTIWNCLSAHHETSNKAREEK